MITTNTDGDSFSAAYLTACAAASRRPVHKLEVQWNGSDWTDETANVLEVNLIVKSGEAGSGLVQLATVDSGYVVLRNVDWRYSPYHSGGDTTVRSDIGDLHSTVGIRFRWAVGFVTVTTPRTEEHCRVFSGYLMAPDEDPTALTVKLTVKDVAWKLTQNKVQSSMLYNQTVDALVYAYAVTYGGMAAEDVVRDTDPVVIPYAWLDNEASFEDLRYVVASVGGVLRTNADGDLVYETAAHWVGHSKVWTFDVDDKQRLKPTYNTDNLITEVVVEYAPRVPGQAGVLWQLDKPVFIRPAETREIEARFTHPALSVFTLPDGEVSRMLDDDYYVTAPNGLNLYDFVRHSNTVTSTAAGATVTIQNMHTSFVACVRFLQLRGLPLIGGPTEQVKVETGAGDNYRTRSERGNPYLQTRQQAAFLANFLADRNKRMLPVWRLDNAPGIPQLEIGDRVGYRDGRAVSTEREGFVVGITHNWKTPQDRAQAPVYNQAIDILDAADLWPSGIYFQIGATALGAGVAWY